MVYHTSGQGTTQAQYELIAHHAFDGSIIPTPTGRTASYVIAASNSSATDKAQADVVCNGTNDIATIQAAVNALVALGNMPDGEGTNTTTGVQGEIYFFDGLYTGTGQLTIPAGSRIALMGESPPSFHPSNSYTAPLAYLGGVEIYFTGTTYPVLSLPLSSNSIPDTTLELNNITFMVKNPVSQQATGVYAFSMPGYVKGDWGYVNFLSDVATSAGGACYNANIEGLDLEAGAHTDIKTWETITIGGFQGNVLHVNTDHMNIDNICMFDCYNAPSPDVLTALYWASVTGIINNMSVENVPIAVLNSSGNLEGPIINTLTLEGTCNQGFIQSTAGGMITIGTLNNLSGPTPLSYAMTQANISKVQYGYAFPADHTTANINSSYNFGISSQTYISQLLNTLGDTRALWLPADAPANASASFTSIKDRTNNNNNLTASSDINGWTNQAWFKGQCQILETDGSSNYLTAASNANMSFTNGTFSLVMMVKFDTMPTWGWILSKTDSNANQEYQVYEYGNEIRVQVFDNVNGGHYERASNAITTNTWYCIVITCNGTLSTGLHIYVNGVLDDVGGAESLTGTCTSMDATSAPVYIAALDNNGSVANYFPGNIGITAITGTCLTQAQVTSATALIKGMMQIP